tara:strand:+ start:7645 stop:8064 length:420 start_codon:yes stop_codon:yes gene_type:complete
MMISRYWVHQKKIMSEKNKRSILIIENDAMILKGLTQRFKKRNMLVITAEDGYEGYVRACNETPDVIITETLLSSMSGFRLSRLLKYDQRYKKIRIVMITTNDLSTVNEMFDACGADRILRKPFRFKELMEAVSEEAEA